MTRIVRMFVATLASHAGLSAAVLADARAALAAIGADVGETRPLDPPHAVDIPFAGVSPQAARSALEAAAGSYDVFVQPDGEARTKHLLVADMDSTIIGQECIDELADFAGRKAEVAAITERAMRGELDFASALAGRVAVLAGLPENAIARTLAERVRLNPGAATLVGTFRARGGTTVLISGGFTVFTQPVARAAGFDRQVANRLVIADGRLAGRVEQPIVDAAVKRATLVAERERLGLTAAQTLAIGDGANDIPMLEEAGLGIAFHAKPRAAAAADAAVRFGDLATILWALGVPRRQWVSAGQG
ncbi:MAG: phosphoserine phosphatase SerB [Sphingomonadaceae bacterium]